MWLDAWRIAWTAIFSLILLQGVVVAKEQKELTSHGLPKPSYHYGAEIPVTCLNRSIDTGEHIHDSNNVLQYIDFPTCAETNKPLSLKYNSDGPQNCTITIDDPLFHLLEFYIHNDAPLSCRVPSRPPFSVSLRPLNTETAADLKEEEKDEYVPLIFALTGQLQLSHLHVNTRMNVLLHSVPKHHRQKRDSGVIDSGTAYSTSPLSASGHTKRVVIGDELTLQFHVRWFQSPELALGAGGGGMGGHVYASTVFYVLAGFGAGVAVCTVYFFGVVLPKKLKGRTLGGATPLGGYGVGNGWGVGKRMD